MQGQGHGHVSPDITGPRTILWLLDKVAQEGDGAPFLLIQEAVVNPGSSGPPPRREGARKTHCALYPQFT